MPDRIVAGRPAEPGTRPGADGIAPLPGSAAGRGVAARLAPLDRRLRDDVRRFQELGRDAQNPFRGLYISEGDIEASLRGLGADGETGALPAPLRPR